LNQQFTPVHDEYLLSCDLANYSGNYFPTGTTTVL